MKTAVASGLVFALSVNAIPANGKRDVDTRYPYTGPAVPVGDWVDPTVKGNGKGFPRLVEPPAVTPASAKPLNNINVIALSYLPHGVNIRYQTPFGLGTAPTVHWGTKASDLCHSSTGSTSSYDRTPPCSEAAVTQCSQFFHDVQLGNLNADTTYYYRILAANGTTASSILNFTTARAAGNDKGFAIAVLNDMGYTNAHGTHQQLDDLADDIAFAWHGVCYNGTSTGLPGGPPIPAEYDAPLPSGELPNQGGPQGGDMSVLYESNWDLWQQWMNSLSMKIPYMVLPGNHEASCGEFDGPNNILTAYLNNDKSNSSAPESALTYYSCPPSQRNFSAYQNRFRMPGSETGGVGNFWYSFDYGMAHFISLNSETDFAYSPEWPFVRDAASNETLPTEGQTFITDSGPFGTIDDNNWKDNEAYQQIQWLKQDLASVDRSKTPWVFAMGHRPMYSSQTSSYQANVRNAFEPLLLQYGVDAYLAGHIHWYERLLPLGRNGTIESNNIVNNNTYYTGTGTSLTHIINGMAGNIESHSTLGSDALLNITTVLNQRDYGFSKLTVHNTSVATLQYIKGDGNGLGDELTLLKKNVSASR
ncbi:MAG: hypothetical protein M1820_006708 [Bogoriella megaspora]|nr:MAG: hypothetical protein M1820_006708 [Bogoriella megaspora]